MDQEARQRVENAFFLPSGEDRELEGWLGRLLDTVGRDCPAPMLWHVLPGADQSTAPIKDGLELDGVFFPAPPRLKAGPAR